MRINLSQNIFQTPQRNNPIFFKGDHDILIVDDAPHFRHSKKEILQNVMADEFQNYKIYEADSPEEAVELANKYKPLFTVSAFHMFNASPDRLQNLFNGIKEAGSKVIVYSGNWHRASHDVIRKAGVERCEQAYGVFKYIQKDDQFTLKTTVNALTEEKLVPRYYFQNDEQQWVYFNALLNIAKDNKDRQMELVNRLDCLPAKHTVEGVTKLIQIADKEIQKSIAQRIILLPKENQVPVAEIFIKLNDTKVNKIIAGNLRYLPEENRTPFTEKLIQINNTEVNKIIANNLECLPEENQVPVAEILIQINDTEVNQAIANNLVCLPKENQVTVAEILIQINDIKVNQIISNNLECLPEENRVSVAEILIKLNDNEVSQAIAYNLDCLPEEKQVPIAEKLIKLNDAEVNQAMVDNLRYLPEKNQIAIKKLLDESASSDNFDVEK